MLSKIILDQQRVPIFFLLGVLILLLFFPRPLAAEDAPEFDGDTHLAGLVVDFGQGQIETRCVAFTEERISGYELLARSGFAFGMDASSSMGAAICQIGETGCPGTDCFCQCQGGGSCAYWSYWRLAVAEGEESAAPTWRYAVAGASMTQVTHGDVQGWRWGDRSERETAPPLSSHFEQICAAELRENTAVSLPSSPSTEKAIITPPDAPSWPAYLAFGLMVSVLGVGLVWVRRE